MDGTLAAVIVTAVISLAGSWLVARSTAQSQQLAVTESERRRIKSLEERVDSLEDRREKDAIVKRALGDHIDVLEDHIWQRKPPPPPARPPGI